MNFAFYLHDEKSQSEFERKLIWFKTHYNIISINELQEHIYDGKPLKNSCMLSVDDGWKSTYDIIYPIMKKHNVPFTVFLSPEVMENEKNFWYYTYQFLDTEEIKDVIIQRHYFSAEVCKFDADMILKELPVDEIYDILAEVQSKHSEVQIPRGFMNTNEVSELLDTGLVEVGAHTVKHPVLANETADRAENEIAQSINRLSSILGTTIKYFAYPNGIEGLDYDKREIDIVRKCGIEMAFSVNPDAIKPSCNPLSLPRWGSIARLKFGLWGKYLPSRMNQIEIRKEIRKNKL